MSKDALMVKQVNFIIVVRRIKTLGIAIMVGISAIYLFGLFVAGSNVMENFETVNLLSLIILVITIPLTLLIRRRMLGKVTLNNFPDKYFNVHVINFCIMDFTALFCITTNLFVNGIILYATAGWILSNAGMILNFPKEQDFEKLKQEN